MSDEDKQKNKSILKRKQKNTPEEDKQKRKNT